MGPILAMDVGGGTLDILLWEPNGRPENSPKFVLPSRTKVLAKRISEITAQGKAIFLTGRLMGGGPVSMAVRAHLSRGLKVFAEKAPALTLHDNIEVVKALGVQIVTEPPDGAVEVRLGDLNIPGLKKVFDLAGLSWPKGFAVAVQDHGHSPWESNRIFRFRFWEGFVQGGGRLETLAFFDPPPYFTRMWAIKGELASSLVMDTASSAILGALEDEEAKRFQANGLTVVNVGNFHTVAFLVKGQKVFGVYEHHSSMLDAKGLCDHLERFRKGSLTNREVLESGGHGCVTVDGVAEASGFAKVVVTGPQRNLADGLNFHKANPFGDMMLTGCFGLIRGYLLRKETG